MLEKINESQRLHQEGRGNEGKKNNTRTAPAACSGPQGRRSKPGTGREKEIFPLDSDRSKLGY